jgi:hypothetical protein
MPTYYFTSIDQLASYLLIVSSMIFTIPVESSDLDYLDLPNKGAFFALVYLICGVSVSF